MFITNLLGKNPVARVFSLVAIFVLSVTWLLPFLSQQALAAQITGRSLTLGSGVPSAVTTYTFNFTVPTTGTVVKSFSATACTKPTSTCTPVTGFSVTGSGINQPTGLGAASGWTVNTATAGSLRMSDASNATNPSGSQAVFFTSVTNPSTPNVAFYLRMVTYSDASWTTPIDAGATAAAVVQTLQVNAQVAEILNFCVGSTTIDLDSAGTVAADCTTVGGTSVNLGTLDPGKINITPESTDCTPADCGKNGVAMVRSNALNGTIIYYDSVQQSGSNHKGSLRISAQNCNATADNLSSDTLDNTDQCFNVRPAQAVFGTTLERFGMTVAGVNCGSTTSYPCTGTGGANPANLVRNASYDGDGTATYETTDVDQINGPTLNGYAWDESGAAVPIASSASSTIKQIDDEALILKFAAHPLITTPFGSYQAQADFIAVSTY